MEKDAGWDRVEAGLGIIGSVSGRLTEWRSTGVFTAEPNEVLFSHIVLLLMVRTRVIQFLIQWMNRPTRLLYRYLHFGRPHLFIHTLCTFCYRPGLVCARITPLVQESTPHASHPGGCISKGQEGIDIDAWL